MKKVIRRLLCFNRRTFNGPNKDIEAALEKAGGAIFLERLRNGKPYNPKEEGERLFKVLSILFPKSTIDVLARKLKGRG